MSEDSELGRIIAVKNKYERTLMRKKNVVGLGVGFREREGKMTEELVLTVLVRRKEPDSQLRPRDLIPSELEGVPVDIKEVGTFQAQ